MPQAAGPPVPGSRNNQAQIADLFFPISGLDVSVALEWQTPDTTPEGVNVRTFEPSTNRARGGQRWGLSKYIDEMLPLSYSSGSPAIQHLQLVVDPQAVALGVSYPPNDGYTVPPLVFIGGFTYLTFAFGSGFPPSAPPNLLVITASNESKTVGNAFAFDGSEFTSNGLQSGDTINYCDFSSSGAPASAGAGKYPIQVFNANISYGSGHTGPAYYVVYEPGTMTVNPVLYQFAVFAQIEVEGTPEIDTNSVNWGSPTGTVPSGSQSSSVSSQPTYVNVTATCQVTNNGNGTATITINATNTAPGTPPLPYTATIPFGRGGESLTSTTTSGSYTLRISGGWNSTET